MTELPKGRPFPERMERIIQTPKEMIPIVEWFFGMTLHKVEKELILSALKKMNYNKSETARMLMIGRSTLARKLRQFGREDGINYIDRCNGEK